MVGRELQYAGDQSERRICVQPHSEVHRQSTSIVAWFTVLNSIVLRGQAKFLKLKFCTLQLIFTCHVPCVPHQIVSFHAAVVDSNNTAARCQLLREAAGAGASGPGGQS